MKIGSKNFEKKGKFFNLLFAAAAAFLALTQTAGAIEPLRLSAGQFSLENLAGRNLLSPAAVLVVNTAGDTSDTLPGDGFCSDGAGNCSLRAGIQESNASAGAQIIDFDIPAGCGQVITPATALPDITDPVTIDGYSAPGAVANTLAIGDNAALCIELNGTNAGSNAAGLKITAVNTTVRGLAIGRFGGAGIEADAAGAIIEGNFLGLDYLGSTKRANFIGATAAANNVRIGGTTLASRNLISGNTRFGIALDQAGTGGTVQNNYVGLNILSNALGNGESGISIFRSSGNTVGGATANARNVVSGNGTTASGGLDGSGIYIFGSSPLGQAPNNMIQGNYVGLNPAGTAAIGNKFNGIKIEGAINTTVTGNTVSGNTIDGIGITGAGATGNIVKGNTVGLDAARTAAVGNTRDGVSIFQVTGNTIGGTGAADGNWIGSNGRYGVLISGTGADSNLVQGNFIGFNSGGAARPQGQAGLLATTSNNTIGGSAAGARNYVAGNPVGIFLAFGSGNIVAGNYVGLTNTGAALGNQNGIALQDTINNTIGGTDAGSANIVSANQFGVRLIFSTSAVTGNRIIGNLIGTNPAGTVAVPNTNDGVLLQGADGNTIGGTTAAERNIISGNGIRGVEINASANNQVIGNYIGTSPDGLSALPNGTGVVIFQTNSKNNTIGGTASGAGNVISGNTGSGVYLTSQVSGNNILGNIIGQKADGSANLPNQNGVMVDLKSTANNIGGTAAGAGNLISGNTQSGILMTDGAFGNFVQGNKIGTDATGTTARANGSTGVKLIEGTNTADTINNTIGGTTTGARNLISGNTTGGIMMVGNSTRGNLVAGNYIGSQADGVGYLGNSQFGIYLDAPLNSIGGGTTAYRNLISGQVTTLNPGILLTAQAQQTVVQNNYIGTTADGSNFLFNGTGITCYASLVTISSNLISGSAYGVIINSVNGGKIVNNVMGTDATRTFALGNNDAITLNDTSNVSIGDDGGTPAPNFIAGNNRNGIVITGTSTGNLISQNSIFSNGLLGIDLGNDGVTQNDAQDPDGGPNRQQNFPIINTATTVISGILNSTPNRPFRLEFFSSTTADASGFGEGKTYLTSQTVTTNAAGNATFSVSNPQPLGSFISATATDLVTSDTSEFSGTRQVLSPTAVTFNGGRAHLTDGGVLVEWQTGRESNNLGFNVYRESSGRRELVTPNLVAGSALTASENLLSEQNYSWLDARGDKDSTYYIEAVDISGATETYGAFGVDSTEAAGSVKTVKNSSVDSATLNNLGHKSVSSTVTVGPVAQLNAKPSVAQTELQKVISKTPTVKLTVRGAGIYRAGAEELFAAGLPAGASAANLRLFADGVEQPINITGTENGVFENGSAIEFYGLGTDTAETDARVYYLSVSTGDGRRMPKTDVQGAPETSGFYMQTVERRDRTIYFSGLLNGDEDNFFGAVVSNAGTAQAIEAAQLAPGGGAAQLEVSLQGVTRSPHSVGIELNGSLISTLNFTETERGRVQIPLPASQLRDGTNTVRLVAGGPSDVSVVDYLRLTYPHSYRAENNALSLTAEGGREITVSNFTSRNVRVFDVTNPDAPVELTAHPSVSKYPNGRIETGSDGKNQLRSYAFRFTPAASGPRNLLAIADDLLAEPAAISFDGPSNLTDRQNAADLLILTPREFADALAPLVRLRQSEGLAVKVVDVEDIYDEFNFGRKSSTAIKAFLKTAATVWNRKPQFVLLAGDASYDPKGYLGNADADVVQTKLVDTETIETASDEWLSDFDGDGVGELVIGRLPARTSDELASMVAKITGYERQKPAGSAAFVADIDDSGYDFAAANESVISLMPKSIGITDIRRDNASAKSQLFSAIENGQSFVSYSGHGSSNIWRGNLLTVTDASAMTNAQNLPMFLMMTCLNGYFQDPTTDSLGEALLRNPQGGAVAVWASSGTATPDVEMDIDRQFISALYGGGNLTIGQAVREAKRNVADKGIRQTWTLLGDPSMRLK